jgi:hypothetical protein
MLDTHNVTMPLALYQSIYLFLLEANAVQSILSATSLSLNVLTTHPFDLNLIYRSPRLLAMAGSHEVAHRAGTVVLEIDKGSQTNSIYT